jgi:hypothetical protein
MREIEALARNTTSPDIKRLNPEFFGKPGDIMNHGGEDDDEHDLIAALAEKRSQKKRISQSSKPEMNKLETECFEMLKRQFPQFPAPRPQAIKFKLARNAFYKPDLFSFSWVGGRPTAWEVKGMRGKNIDRGKLALKVAASAWPEIRFVLAWKDNGQWFNQEILP